MPNHYRSLVIGRLLKALRQLAFDLLLVRCRGRLLGQKYHSKTTNQLEYLSTGKMHASLAEIVLQLY